MKILLQHRKTGLYYQQPDGWTREPAMASDFRTSQAAREQINAQSLKDVQVVAVFLGGNYVESVSYAHTRSFHASTRVRV